MKRHRLPFKPAVRYLDAAKRRRAARDPLAAHHLVLRQERLTGATVATRSLRIALLHAAGRYAEATRCLIDSFSLDPEKIVSLFEHYPSLRIDREMLPHLINAVPQQGYLQRLLKGYREESGAEAPETVFDVVQAEFKAYLTVDTAVRFGLLTLADDVLLAAASRPGEVPRVVSYSDVETDTGPAVDAFDAWGIAGKTLFSRELARARIAAGLGEEVTEAFDCCKVAASRADLFALCELYLHGGLYIAAPAELVGDIDHLFGTLAVLEAERMFLLACTKTNTFVSNKAIWARPQDPVIKRMIGDIAQNLRNIEADQDPSHLTGIHALTTSFGRYTLTDPTVFGTSVFISAPVFASIFKPIPVAGAEPHRPADGGSGEVAGAVAGAVAGT